MYTMFAFISCLSDIKYHLMTTLDITQWHPMPTKLTQCQSMAPNATCPPPNAPALYHTPCPLPTPQNHGPAIAPLPGCCTYLDLCVWVDGAERKPLFTAIIFTQLILLHSNLPQSLKATENVTHKYKNDIGNKDNDDGNNPNNDKESLSHCIT